MIKPFRTVPDSEGPAGGSVADLQIKKRNLLEFIGEFGPPESLPSLDSLRRFCPTRICGTGRRWSGAVCTSSSTGDTSSILGRDLAQLTWPGHPPAGGKLGRAAERGRKHPHPGARPLAAESRACSWWWRCLPSASSKTASATPPTPQWGLRLDMIPVVGLRIGIRCPLRGVARSVTPLKHGTSAAVRSSSAMASASDKMKLARRHLVTGTGCCLGPDRLGGSFDIRILCA